MEKYLTTTKPLTGRIKQRYSDFIVEEVLEDGYVCKATHYVDGAIKNFERIKIPENTENFEHLIIELEKVNTDTNLAIALLARGLGLGKTRFGYAGLKDKRAITCQMISIYQPDVARMEKFGVKGLKTRNPKWSSKRIELGELKGNNFTITLRGVEKSEEEAKRIVEEFAEQVKVGLPNYFGNQRFGGLRQVTHRVGKLLLQGKFEEGVMLYLTETYEGEKEDLKNARINLAKTMDFSKAMKEFPSRDARAELAMLNHLVKEPRDFAGAFQELPKKMRYLFTHAYQSYLFNKIIDKRFEVFGKDALKIQEGDVLENGEPTALLSGFESSFPEGKIGEIEKQVLEKEGFTLKDFEVKGVSELSSKGTRKSIVLKPENFVFVGSGKDEFNEGKNFVKIQFFLSKGNYATTVIRELMKEEIF